MLQFQTNQPIDNLAVEIGGVQIDLTSVKSDDEKSKAFLAIAKIALSELPVKDKENKLIIDSDIRKRCEFGITMLANLLSVFNACSKAVYSPSPCAVLEFESDVENQYLQSSAGIFVEEKRDNGAFQPIEFKPELVSQLMDRLDGVTLLSEHYCSSEAGKYKELVRYFELAFKLPFVQIEKKLYQFLKPAPFGYSREEIKKWISFRHASFHADHKKSREISITSDVQSYLMRMEQAAIDVLFNKTHWRSSSSLRRDTWRPEAWSTSKEGEMTALKNTKLSLLFRVYDEFGVYPKKLGLEISDIKDNWYCSFNQDHVPNFPTKQKNQH